MAEIDASKFKEQCPRLLDHLGPEGIVITKRGKPIVRLIPEGSRWSSLIGSMKGKIRIKGDINSTRAEWNAQS